MTHRERMEVRAERRRTWAEGRGTKAEAAFGRAHEIADRRPLGQPILVGHHSEGRHRRDLERQHVAEDKGYEHAAMALHHAGAATEIERQMKRSIYSDDPDAPERLLERIAELQEQRNRMKKINAQVRRGDGWPERIDPPLTDRERADLMDAARYSRSAGYPSYALTNIGANIRRLQKRLDGLR